MCDSFLCNSSEGLKLSDANSGSATSSRASTINNTFYSYTISAVCIPPQGPASSGCLVLYHRK